MQMQTLKELYEEIANDSKRWSYYNTPNLSIEKKWENNSHAFKFIKSYFNLAGKSNAFKDEHLEKNKTFIEDRAAHIISAFLLGIKIAESFDVNITTRNEENMNFQYYWFLTCLYHDIGYAYEKKSNYEHLSMLQEDGLEALQEICDIKYLHNRIFKTFSCDEVEFYLKCRSECKNGKKGTIDHGIVGGILLYDKLRKQFAIAWRKRKDKPSSRKSFFIKDECSLRELHLSNSHYAEYAKAADAIIAHNIWISTFNEYVQKYDPDKNFTSIGRKISMSNKLCFILSLADTIEPIKRFGGEALKYIGIEAIDKGFKVLCDSLDNENYFKDIESLTDWLDITVKRKNSNIIELSI